MRKQHKHDGVCVRCEMKPAAVRMVCIDCDMSLQQMHYAVEYVLDNKTRYMVEQDEPQWFVYNGFKLTKPPAPRRFIAPQIEPAEAPA